MKKCLILIIVSLIAVCSCHKTPDEPEYETSYAMFHKELSMDSDFILRNNWASNRDPWTSFDKEGNLCFDLRYPLFDYYSLNPSSVDRVCVMETDSPSGQVTIDIPDSGEADMVEIPFSFTFPWSFVLKSVPEEISGIEEILYSFYSNLEFWLNEDSPLSYALCDLSVTLPNSLKFSGKYPTYHNREFSMSNSQKNNLLYLDPRIAGKIKIPEEYRDLHMMPIMWSDDVMVSGTFILEKAALPAGEKWPSSFQVYYSFYERDYYYNTQCLATLVKTDKPVVLDVAEKIFTRDPGWFLPASLMYYNPVLKFVDTRLDVEVKNRTPYTYSFGGNIKSTKNGETVKSFYFGEKKGKDIITIEPSPDMTSFLSLSENNAFPVGDYYESYLIDGFSSLFEPIPDQIILSDFILERMNDGYVNLENDGTVSMKIALRFPYRAADGFSIGLLNTLDIGDFAKEINCEPLRELDFEARISSTLPFNITISSATIDNIYTAEIDKESATLPAAIGNESSQRFKLHFPSEIHLSTKSFITFIFRFEADKECENQNITQSMSVKISNMEFSYLK